MPALMMDHAVLLLYSIWPFAEHNDVLLYKSGLLDDLEEDPNSRHTRTHTIIQSQQLTHSKAPQAQAQAQEHRKRIYKTYPRVR